MNIEREQSEVVKFPVVPRPIPPATRERPAQALDRYFSEYEFYPQKTSAMCAEHLLLWLRANGFKVVALNANE